MKVWVFPLLATSLLTSGCSSLSTGQSEASDIVKGSTQTLVAAPNPVGSSADYVLVNLRQDIMPILAKATQSATYGSLRTQAGRASIALGIGDIISIAIYEHSSAGGLYSPPAAPGTQLGGVYTMTLPNQVIDQSGNVTVPFVQGTVRAAGLTIGQLQNEIVRRLDGRAVQPQVVVSVTERHSNLVTVVGEVNTPQRMHVDLIGLRVLDAVAQAGGSKWPPYETRLTVRRGGSARSVMLSQIMQSGSGNSVLGPGDTLEVTRVQRYFNVIGATGKNGRVDFNDDNISLADAVALGGGLNDDKADAASIFLYRRESRATLEQLGVDLTQWDGTAIPTVYRVDMRNPGGIFLAQNFNVRERDFVIVSNADATQLNKGTKLVSGFTGILRDLAGVAYDASVVNSLANTATTTIGTTGGSGN